MSAHAPGSRVQPAPGAGLVHLTPAKKIPLTGLTSCLLGLGTKVFFSGEKRMLVVFLKTGSSIWRYMQSSETKCSGEDIQWHLYGPMSTHNTLLTFNHSQKKNNKTSTKPVSDPPSIFKHTNSHTLNKQIYIVTAGWRFTTQKFLNRV